MQGGQRPSLGMDSVQDTVPRDQGGCCPALRRLLPVGFWAEVWTLIALSGPLYLFQVLTFMIHFVSSVFCGHLGKLELAAVTLAVAFVNICGVSIGLGLSSACDTLMSQSFGSPNKKHVGVILQRGTLVLLLCCFPCWALFLNTETILLLFRQDPAVSRLTQEYVLIVIPMLPACFLYVLLAKYLQNQGIVWPQVFSGIVGNCINGLANYILVSMLSLGVKGSAYAVTVSYFVQIIFLFLYIVLKKLHLETWAGAGGCPAFGELGRPAAGRTPARAQGWSRQCLQDWGSFFSLAIPSMLMICIEWWAYEIGTFLMGLISVLDLSSQAIIYELATIVYMIPLGLSNAVCVRVGTSLGAADTVQAKRSAISGMLCTVGTSLVVGMLLSILKNKLGHIFTNDEEVIALVNEVLPIYIVFQLFEAICCVYGGVLRGTGKQAFGALANAVMYYVIGLPLGIVLTFVVRMGIMGLWLGMLACGLLAAAAFAVYTARMDWKLAAEEAQKHAGLLPQSPNGAVSTVSTVSTAPRPGPAKAVTSSVATGSSPGITLMTYSRPECHLDLFRTPEAAHALSAPASILSAKQLVIRRGAALVVASAMLTVGLVIRLLTTRH
ncbi:multidrug and toxin extrusion protein 2 isoform X4 [Canis lupus familiaris]|uniref:multidrug and toxin extrusion protein 2 isoform X4 n=1 Tax=Canis lupus familiaris TaxID=9615 RepID=UPI0006B3C56F|nr:multidrug and toxin extrusion protein 2 isoform X4 [Canis lupus familiaris]XP_025284010.1 multidrug and toxin extrusion protein 2 isoform X4 [Canis lupus dingo]XP_038392973.1 multidrug and toxin extrusion protein 2 isoform X4 [Canis lupus familiaris]XP_038521678.1 multidrug and toxin extrusion protein 2 isoform X4 [Canis lupus familiaris]|eukprot:XP_013969124.1 multidrug and toxin extrusion protein 2 isoform X11 [Canis lupus familiaris]